MESRLEKSEKTGNHSYSGPSFTNSKGEEVELISVGDNPPDKFLTAIAVKPSNEYDERWTDSLRDDLNCIPLAISKGWLPKFSLSDKYHCRTTPGNVPLDTLTFSKDNKVTWKVYSFVKEVNGVYHPLFEAWRVADFIDGIYRNHRVYEFLRDVFLDE